MVTASETADAIVIGGGFYGAVIAHYLAATRGLQKVVLLEREAELMTRASYNNQARVHNGYHYPRSFTTAYRSRANFPRFMRDWPDAVSTNFTKLYGIARRNSNVSARQFLRFCEEIEADIRSADAKFMDLFDPNLIEDVFLVEEAAFDARRLAQWASKAVLEAGVEICLSTRATEIRHSEHPGILSVQLHSPSGGMVSRYCRYLFNCTYSGLNQFSGDFPGTQTDLKHELAEIALIDVPAEMKDVGLTVMDGPFFSIMPFPARDLHSLSHVRYTPHFSWQDDRDHDPDKTLRNYEKHSRVGRMIRDVARYIPSMRAAKHIASLFEVKTVLAKNEGDDGRPILFEKHAALPGCYSILGGKLDNIYDVLEKLDTETFVQAPVT